GKRSGHSVRLLAFGRRILRGLRRRGLHRRNGRGGGEGSVPVPARSTGKVASSQGGAGAGRREIGREQAGDAWTRAWYCRDGCVRKLSRTGDGGIGRCARR